MSAAAQPVFEVIQTGPLTTFQDRGRPGLAHFGVSGSGAVDRGSYELANRLVGNRANTAALEVTFGGLTLRALAAGTAAIAGAEVPITAGDRAAAGNSVIQFGSDDLLRLGTPTTGLRSYLALRQGFAVDAVLGSRSTDVLSGLGPAPLQPGQVLYRSTEAALPYPGVDLAPAPAPSTGVSLRVRWGPREDWFTPDSRRRFIASSYTVSSDSNRIAARLHGAALARAVAGELPSEGLVAGAIQVPSDGTPLIFLADHPTTGGYPVVAVVHPRDLDLVAQCRPGDVVRFRPA